MGVARAFRNAEQERGNGPKRRALARFVRTVDELDCARLSSEDELLRGKRAERQEIEARGVKKPDDNDR